MCEKVQAMSNSSFANDAPNTYTIDRSGFNAPDGP